MYEVEKDTRSWVRDMGAFVLGAIAAAILITVTHTHDDKAEFLRGKSEGFADCSKPSKIERLGKFLGEP